MSDLNETIDIKTPKKETIYLILLCFVLLMFLVGFIIAEKTIVSTRNELVKCVNQVNDLNRGLIENTDVWGRPQPIGDINGTINNKSSME